MVLNTAPLPPLNFIRRPAEYDELIEHLLSQSDPGPLAITTVLQGGGGFGKTVLAQDICRDARVEAAFPGGILWVEFGQSPTVIQLLNNQIQLLENNDSLTDINAAAARLRELLAKRRVLLVLDDVWYQDHLTPFIQPSPTSCAHLITTRNQDLVRLIGAQLVSVRQPQDLK